MKTQPRRPWLESSLLWEAVISHQKHLFPTFILYTVQ